jgi:hypothetical protein
MQLADSVAARRNALSSSADAGDSEYRSSFARSAAAGFLDRDLSFVEGDVAAEVGADAPDG